MSRIKKSDRIKMELVLLVMMIAAGYFICRESGVQGVNYFTGLVIMSAFTLLTTVSVGQFAAAKLIRDALSDEEWESFNFYNVFARDGMNPGSADVMESMNKKVNAVILRHYWVRFFDYRH